MNGKNKEVVLSFIDEVINQKRLDDYYSQIKQLGYRIEMPTA